MRRILLSLSLAGSISLIGCEGDPLVPQNGSITLHLVAPEAQSAATAVATSANGINPEAERQGPENDVQTRGGSLADASAAAEPGQAPQLAQVPLESVRVTVSGPTSTTRTFSCTPATCEGTVDGLAEGTYSVRVEGLVGSEVDHFGEAAGVTVAGGQNTQATVTFGSFVPVLDPFVAETVDVPHFTVSYSAVPSADSYLVEWATNPGFTGASSQSVTGTSTEVVVDEDAEYFVRVRAVNDAVGTSGRASDVLSLATFHAVASVIVSPPTPTIAAGTTQQFTAEARDVEDNVLDPVAIFWDSSDPTVATVDQSGLVTGVGAGNAIITALAKGQPGSASLTVTVEAKLVEFLVEPTASVEGTAINPALQVVITDGAGLRVRSFSDPVTLAIGTNPSGGALWGTSTVNAVDGVATFSGVSIDWAGAGYTLVASSGALTGATSAPFDVTAGAKPSGARVLANTSYVDFSPGDLGSEASNVLATLRSVGVSAEPFVDLGESSILDVTRRSAILAFAEPFGDVVADMSAASRQRIVDFVEHRGGTLLIFLEFSNTIVNSLFGHSLVSAGAVGPYPILGGASGTPFQAGPPSLPAPSATTGLDPATLPAGSIPVYGVATSSVVVVIPQGAGRIVNIGWDWFDAAPIGAQDGGWVEVLRRATLF